MIRMLIIDDDYYIRIGIQNSIDWESLGVEIIGDAEDGEQGLEAILQLKPDLILLDVCMPFMNGLELLEQLANHKLNCNVIILSGYDEFEYAQMAIKYGVIDYLLKPIDKEKLVESILKTRDVIRKKASIHYYQQLISKEQHILTIQFIKELLCNRLSDSNLIYERIKALDLPFCDVPCRTIYLKIDDFILLEQQYSIEIINNICDNINKLLSEYFLLGKGFLGVLADISHGQWAIILSHLNNLSEAEQDTELRKNTSEFLKKLSDELEYKVFVSISVSEICYSPLDLPKVFQASKHATKKYLPCTNSVIWPDNDSLNDFRPEVKNTLRFINEHFSENITVQQIADSLYLSPYYLMHIFKNETGKTLVNFLTELRIEKAKELLKEPGCKIYEIATQIGYSDVKYFNKLFKKHTGLSPSEYTKIHYAEF